MKYEYHISLWINNVNTMWLLNSIGDSMDIIMGYKEWKDYQSDPFYKVKYGYDRRLVANGV